MTGISGFGVYVPKRRLMLKDYFPVWENCCFTDGISELGIKQRAVLSSDEDTNTLAVMAAKETLAHAAIDRKDIGAFYLATRTGPYSTRPSSTLVAEALGLASRISTSDILAGNRSGVAALVSGLSLVDSTMVSHALVVAADTIGREVESGSLHDVFGGSGAVGFILSDEDVVAEFKHVCSGLHRSEKMSDLDAVCCDRVDGADSLAHLKAAEDNLIKNLTAVVSEFFATMNVKPQDFNHAVLPQPYGKIAERLAKRLGFKHPQFAKGLVTPELGDCGGASVLIGLSAVLDSAHPGETILLVSYDAGAYDIIGLQVTPAVIHKRKKEGALQKHLFSDLQIINYATAMKLEHKYCKVPFELNAFM